ncbi:MAG: BrnT family toxin [Nevskiales bacterium]
MDVRFELNGATFIWDDAKARMNMICHDGIAFEQAAEVFFDPLFRLVDASRNDEARDAVIGYDSKGRMLFVVHVELEDRYIRIVSARKATPKEREHYDS